MVINVISRIALSPDLRVQFAMTVSSTANISCRPFEGAFLSGFYGRYACASNGTPLVYANNGTNSNTDSSSNVGDGGLPRAAILALAIVFPILGLIFWICVIWWLVRRRRRHRREILALQQQVAASRNPDQMAPSQNPSQIAPYKPDVFVQEKAELDATTSIQHHAPASTVALHELESPSIPSTQHQYSPVQGHTVPPHQTLPAAEPKSRLQDVDAREKALAEREKVRLPEELNERERALAERERRMEEWERDRNRGGGNAPA
jgi:cbb3-type cytochrome oxidase subunit 3